MKDLVDQHVSIEALTTLLMRYFDALYYGDSDLLRRIFHPAAIYACPTYQALKLLQMDDYFKWVDTRGAPHHTQQPREDRILSIELVSSDVAVARVECSIESKRFSDVLSLIRTHEEWRIIAKVFHFSQTKG